MNPAASWKIRVGNGVVLLALGLVGLALLRLRSGASWWPGAALPWQWQLAGGSLLAYAALCGAIASARARAAGGGNPGSPPMLVAWASQTGFASELAERSVAALRAAGVAAQALPLSALDAETLGAAEGVLFVVSTTGEGDPPDNALAFLRHTQPQLEALPRLRYGLLALGDRSYDDFCAFGRQLDDWLAGHGAHALFDRVEVDNADPGALRHWQYLIGQLGDGATQADWERPQYQQWRLQSRQHSNPGCGRRRCLPHFATTSAGRLAALAGRRYRRDWPAPQRGGRRRFPAHSCIGRRAQRSRAHVA